MCITIVGTIRQVVRGIRKSPILADFTALFKNASTLMCLQIYRTLAMAVRFQKSWLLNILWAWDVRRKQKSNALPVQMDAQGRIKFDSLLRQGQPKDKVIHSRFDQVVAKQVKANDDPDLMRPDTEKMMEVRLHF